ncbi:MAG TPA: endonuclease III [Anaerolineales bacterium]|jgi:endonuclease-3
MPILADKALKIRNRLLAEYGEPVWRTKLPPVAELVSTILSQNTNDDNRDLAYNRLRQALPSWEAVRDAAPEQVIEAIRPAGLANQKGPRIQAALAQITEDHGGLDLAFLRDQHPDQVLAWLTKFKGVGPKTASIVMLFSLDLPAFPVDTHIHRVSGRLGLRPARANAEQAHDILADLFPPETYYDVHLNLIRHGRQVCQARRPRCENCFLTDLCDYFASLDAIPVGGQA